MHSVTDELQKPAAVVLPLQCGYLGLSLAVRFPGVSLCISCLGVEETKAVVFTAVKQNLMG